MHHKRDWPQYNKQLVNRGNINFWINPSLYENMLAPKTKKNGRPFMYSNALILAMLYIRFKFHLSLRETEGFFQSLFALLKFLLKAPCYTQISRRMKNLQLSEELTRKQHVTDIVLDTTGLKVYSTGEWRAEKYGGRKAWKKLHLAMDPLSGKLVLAEVTDEHVHDTTYLGKALERANQRKGQVLIDGIADTKKCYELAMKHNKILLTPPKRGAVLRKEEVFERRNDAVRIIHGLGNDQIARSIWGKLVGYSRRVVVESMVARWKSIFGNNLRSLCTERQKLEAQIKAMMINEMIAAAA